ncbi:hypothetical protein VHEMI06434 [[Torrubiella] hemipterigena]|uniref:YTH domain-containing protein n=1 Tax=[Torrubiella] hemipterigena TaxID=1531966 RepID=A0A0A1TL56_9HYPO|nr:hypothetical protein VHEMI06434 [[Torrubiella] hemipterigena]
MGDLPDTSTTSAQQAYVSVGNTSASQRQTPQNGAGQRSALQHGQPSRQQAFHSQFDATSQPSQQPGQMAFQMGHMGNDLPQTNYRGGQVPPGYQQAFHASSQAAMMQQMQQMQQYNNQQSQMPSQGYYGQTQLPQYYSTDQMNPHGPPPNLMVQPGVQYYATQMPMAPQSPTFYANPQPNRPGRNQHGQQHSNWQQQASQPTQSSRSHHQNRPKITPIKSSNSIRGPPRKPKQSGHAIWIGNLPPATKLLDLVDHVCQETENLESLFLISKSNCAFANFKDEQMSLDAQAKLHDSKFQSIRLVCRLRKVEGTGDKTNSTDNSIDTAPAEKTEEEVVESASPVVGYPPKPSPAEPSDTTTTTAPTSKDRFFILKSLSLEDLERSLQTGIWATQSHNEAALGEAHKTADNVYLIFSANKSGEYFGYARMTSPINQDPAAAIEFAPQYQAPAEIDTPKATVAEATEKRPAGRVIDDSTRGTTFWEIEREDVDVVDGEDDDVKSTKTDDADEEIQTLGKPFHLQWLSSSRLPFYRTRGLRNPWNSNREVKIARDGTELEPSVGQKLVALFNRNQSQGYPAQHLQMQMPQQETFPGFNPLTRYSH